ncbi:MAG: Dam family site-specific DNA-(adenine-N6)-methyltransferase, partial [Halobacteriota archaeon]|nr:Dam family site-specific DNA-(adenine-N6)-methyltransferase [Halobacteriota archaeon]
MKKDRKITPFLRWIGGKSRLVSHLENYIPPNFCSKNCYYEPFLGAGSLFFRITPSKAYLADNNKDLIDCYIAIKNNPELISKYLRKHLENSSKEYYLKMRDKYNSSRLSNSKAALFIYLNKTCFNGIWRVNEKGHFNVPYGYKEPPLLPSKNDLLDISKALSNVKLTHKDYKDTVTNTNEGDFIYLDPPYPPLNGTSYFTHYTKERFTKDNHTELALIARELDEMGCFVMISNADIPYIRSLYEDSFNVFNLEVT